MPMLPIYNHWTLGLVIGNTGNIGNILQLYRNIMMRPVGLKRRRVLVVSPASATQR